MVPVLLWNLGGWSIFKKSSRLFHFVEQQQQVHRCLSRLYSFVSNITTGSLNCLIHGIACQDTKRDWNLVVQAESTKAVADGRIDMLVMSGFAPDHTTQCQNGVVQVSFKRPLNGTGDFPGAGDP